MQSETVLPRAGCLTRSNDSDVRRKQLAGPDRDCRGLQYVVSFVQVGHFQERTLVRIVKKQLSTRLDLWSPDGMRIAFNSRRSGDLRVSGKNQLTVDARNDSVGLIERPYNQESQAVGAVYDRLGFFCK